MKVTKNDNRNPVINNNIYLFLLTNITKFLEAIYIVANNNENVEAFSVAFLILLLSTFVRKRKYNEELRKYLNRSRV